MLATSSSSELLPLPTNSFSYYIPYHTFSTYYHNTLSLENFTFNLGKPQSSNLPTEQCQPWSDLEHQHHLQGEHHQHLQLRLHHHHLLHRRIIISTFIKYFRRSLTIIITPGLECSSPPSPPCPSGWSCSSETVA